MPLNFYREYVRKTQSMLSDFDFGTVHELAGALRDVWESGKKVFICGNGGSAANAMHLANDLLFGISRQDGRGLKAMALTADSSVMTCLANDLSYESIFSSQLTVLGEKGDLLIALSGSGNSPNVVKALKVAKELEMNTFAILGFSGGQCLELANHVIHFPIEDMQIAEDMQLLVGHMVMRWLSENRPVKNARYSDGL